MGSKISNIDLGSIIEIYNGRPYSTLREIGNFPVFGSGGLMGYTDDFMYTGEAILLPRKGTINNIQYLNSGFWVVDTTYFAVVNKTKADTKFLWNYLTLISKQIAENLDSGSAVPSMTQKAYEQIKILLPNLSTQRAIARVLSQLDEKIEINRKINAELENMAKTIYDYWFLQFDFPNAEGKPYRSSGGAMEYNPTLKREVPKGWEAITFSKIINENKETLGAGFDRGAEHSIDLSVMPSGTMCLNGRGKASDFDSNKFVLRKFDLLFGSIRPYLKKSGFSAFDGALNSSVLNFRPIKKDNYSFALCTLTSELMLQYAVMISSGQGTRMPTIRAEEILGFPIAYNSDLAKVFNNKVSAYWQQIASNINQNFELANLRDFLLPLLMNGQVTVEKKA